MIIQTKIGSSVLNLFPSENFDHKFTLNVIIANMCLTRQVCILTLALLASSLGGHFTRIMHLIYSCFPLSNIHYLTPDNLWSNHFISTIKTTSIKISDKLVLQIIVGETSRALHKI